MLFLVWEFTENLLFYFREKTHKNFQMFRTVRITVLSEKFRKDGQK